MENRNLVVIVDMTRHKGESLPKIHQVNRYVKSKYHVAKTVWNVRPDQVAFLRDNEYRIDHEHLIPGITAKGITEWLIQMSQNGHAGSRFIVLSYDGDILNAVGNLNDRFHVVPLHLTALNEQTNNAGGNNLSPAFLDQGQSSLSLEDAIELAKQVLQQGGHTTERTSLQLSKLRPRMVEKDSRARKFAQDLLSLNLIRLIVEDGRQKGWLQFETLSGRGGGYEYVWLVENDEWQSTTLKADDPEKVATECSSTDAIVRETMRRNGVDRGGGVYFPPESVEQKDPSEVMVRSNMQYPSYQMECKLRERRIGSPVVPREFLYAAVEEILARPQDKPLTTSSLVEQAWTLAKEKATNNGYAREQNWEAIGDCFLRMMLGAKVLLRANGTPIVDGIGAYSAVVAKIEDGFRDLCEAYLVEYLIKSMGNLSLNDRYDLGLALYQRGKKDGPTSEWLRERIDFLLQLLQEKGRIGLAESGTLVANS